MATTAWADDVIQRHAEATRAANAEIEREAAAKEAERARRKALKEQAVRELKRLAEFPSQVTADEVRATAVLALEVLGNRGRRLIDGQEPLDAHF